MLINYLTTRKALGYQYLIDTKWSDRLMLITDSTFVVVKNVGVNNNIVPNIDSNYNRKIF